MSNIVEFFHSNSIDIITLTVNIGERISFCLRTLYLLFLAFSFPFLDQYKDLFRPFIGFRDLKVVHREPRQVSISFSFSNCTIGTLCTRNIKLCCFLLFMNKFLIFWLMALFYAGHELIWHCNCLFFSLGHNCIEHQKLPTRVLPKCPFNFQSHSLLCI